MNKAAYHSRRRSKIPVASRLINERMTRFVTAFDLHGDQQEPSVVKAFHRHCREFKPHRRILGGDFTDMRPFRGKASHEEKRESVGKDVDAAVKFIKEFEPTDALLGNHDQRLWDLAAERSGPLSDYAKQLVDLFKGVFGGFRCRLLPYDFSAGVVQLGRLKVVHGFFAGQDAVKKHAEIYGPCIFGHIHAEGHCVLPRHGSRVEAWSSPCLCKKKMPYNVRTPSTLRYTSGWVYGAYDRNWYHVQVARVENGSVAVSDSIRLMAA